MTQLYRTAVASMVVGAFGMVISLTPFGMELEENLGLHLLFKIRGKRKAPPDVIIITLDKASADHLHLPSAPRKWPRSLHARLINNLIDKKPAVIAFDMIFSETGPPEQDNIFADAIRKAGNIVLGEWLKTDKVALMDQSGAHTGALDIEKIVPPIPLLAQSALSSAHFSLPKVPVKVNSYWAYKTGAGDLPTLPVVVFQIYAMPVYNDLMRWLITVSPDLTKRLPASSKNVFAEKNVKDIIRRWREYFEQNPAIAEKLLERLRLSNTLGTDAKLKQILVSLIRMYQSPKSPYLNYYGPAGTIRTIPYYRMIEDPKNSSGGSILDDLTGKVIFIGLSEQLRPEEKDGFYTVFSGPNGLDISGVEIAATAFANLLENSPVEPLNLGVHIAIVALWGAGLTILCLLSPPVMAAGSLVGFSLLYMGFAHFQFKHHGLWYPLIVPLFLQAPAIFFGAVLLKYFQANRERRNIRTAFGYYLPDDVVNRLAKNMSDIRGSSRVVYGICLFTDAQHYTAFSETMDPEELSSFLNTYYEAIFEPVRKNSGIISDVAGDSMLALWPTAHPDATAKNRACCAALDIVRAVEQFNQPLDGRELPIRIGMHSGYISLGNVGAMDHFEYRPVGDIVNTASRMEGLNKFLSTRILVSAEVLDQLDGFSSRPLGKFILAGKSKPVEVNELICKAEEFKEEQKNLCRVFVQGIDAYQRQSWGEAIDFFSAVLKLDNTDGPARFFLALCEKYRANPPATHWDGTVYLNKK
jgi:adenylate cyclase